MASNDGACNFSSPKEEEEEKKEQKQAFRHQHLASKAQMCLHKILHIITTIPPPAPPPPPSSAPPPASATPLTQNQDLTSSSNASESKRGVDLNLTFLDTEENEQNLESPASESTVVSAVEESLSGGRCDIIGGALHDDKKSLELLIEAAKVVFGCEFEEEKRVSGNGRLSESTRLLRRRYWKNAVEEDYVAVEEDDVMLSPVVRSKRGRTQVLPYKYRDSVLEPLTRLSRPKRATNAVPTKRRSTSSRSFFI